MSGLFFVKNTNMRSIGIFIAYFLIFQFNLKAQDRTVGTQFINVGATDGFTLFSPAGNGITYLINNCGQVVNTWESAYNPGASVYMLSDGSIIRAGSVEGARLGEPGVGGVFERISWEGDIIWSWQYSNDQVNAHHDFHVRDNGNIILIAWELKTEIEAIDAGRDPSTLSGDELWPDHIIEIEPMPNNGAQIVWEWYAWDHLIQDFDDTKENFGVVEDNPGKIDINYRMNDEPDWNHLNSIHFNEEKDLLALSSPFFNEIWIIDRNTTTEEAQGTKGDLLFRWGNPAAYKQGTTADQKLFFQHTVEFLEDGLGFDDNLIIFNNGRGRSPNEYSSVDFINPYNSAGEFFMEGSIFGPSDLEASYQRNNPTDLFASFISGAQLLSNGNLLIDDGPNGTFIEVDFQDNEYWKYISPISSQGISSQGDPVNGNLVFRATKYDKDYLNFRVSAMQTVYIEGNPLPLENCLPLSTDSPLSNVYVYPNPVIDNFTIKGNYHELVLVDMAGIKQEIKYIPNTQFIDIAHLNSGLYHLIIDDQKPIKIVKK